MSEGDCARFRAQAEQCRRLAKAVHDRRTFDTLQETARDFEAEADRLEKEPPPTK